MLSANSITVIPINIFFIQNLFTYNFQKNKRYFILLCFKTEKKLEVKLESLKTPFISPSSSRSLFCSPDDVSRITLGINIWLKHAENKKEVKILEKLHLKLGIKNNSYNDTY